MTSFVHLVPLLVRLFSLRGCTPLSTPDRVLAATLFVGDGLKKTSAHCTEAATAIPKWNIKDGANFLVCEQVLVL